MISMRWALCALLLQTTVVFAADNSDKFAMKGAAFLPCKIYVNEREKKSNVYYMVGGWIEGYISAHNRYTDDTYDVMSFESLELLLTVMQNHCQSNPNDRLYSVLDSILAKIGPDRLQHESPRVQISEGERNTILYREVINRIQTELTRLDLYKGSIDGRFTDETKAALIAFQSDIKFETTGFPDQTTLWRLLRK